MAAQSFVTISKEKSCAHQWKMPTVAKNHPSVWQANCQPDEIACTYSVDSRGCQEATLCRAKGTDKDGELCLGVCPPTCGADEILTAGATDAKGCETAPTCVPII